MRTAKTLIRLGGCPDWSESSLGAHSFVGFVMSRLICLAVFSDLTTWMSPFTFVIQGLYLFLVVSKLKNYNVCFREANGVDPDTPPKRGVVTNISQSMNNVWASHDFESGMNRMAIHGVSPCCYVKPVIAVRLTEHLGETLKSLHLTWQIFQQETEFVSPRTYLCWCWTRLSNGKTQSASVRRRNACTLYKH